MKEHAKLVVYVPTEHADKIREVLGGSGAGTIGNYSYCSFSSKGTGRFVPNKEAKPSKGMPNTLEEVPEERIEVTCKRHQLEHLVDIVKKTLPYEEPVIEIYPIYSL